ncbi:hypothetical protein F4604DRAFT_1948452 [Suillus subluteus]|nr:hypothetical protein F4604DRAFT_1948452 [Suillus subluteus]
MDNLQTLVEMQIGKDSGRVLYYTVQKAVVTSSKEIMTLRGAHPESLGILPILCTEQCAHIPPAILRLGMHRAHLRRVRQGRDPIFTTIIKGCDMQSNLVVKTFSICGLGDIAFARSNFALATQRFEETRSLCAEMGVPPQHLCSCMPLYTLPDKFKGWLLFLEGLSPFANDTM